MLRRGRVEVTGGFLLLMAWLNYCDTQNLLPAVLCAAVAHELGHLAAVCAARGRVSRLRLTAAGAELQLEGTLSYGREFICAIAGPVVNLVLAFCAARMGAAVFAGLNLALGLFNLLPMSVLDGGRALSCLTALLLGPEWARRVSVTMDKAVLFLLLLSGVSLLSMGGNVTLLVVGVWLVRMFHTQKDKSWRKKGLSRAS